MSQIPVTIQLVQTLFVHHILWENHLWGAQVGGHPKWNKPAFTPGPHNVTSLWLVLISRQMRVEGWVGLAGLVKYWWFIHPKTVTHCRGGGESNSRPLSRKSDTLTTRQSHYSTINIVVHNLSSTLQLTCRLKNWEKNLNILKLMQGPQCYLRLYLAKFIQLSFI